MMRKNTDKSRNVCVVCVLHGTMAQWKSNKWRWQRMNWWALHSIRHNQSMRHWTNEAGEKKLAQIPSMARMKAVGYILWWISAVSVCISVSWHSAGWRNRLISLKHLIKYLAPQPTLDAHLFLLSVPKQAADNGFGGAILRVNSIRDSFICTLAKSKRNENEWNVIYVGLVRRVSITYPKNNFTASGLFSTGFYV